MINSNNPLPPATTNLPKGLLEIQESMTLDSTTLEQKGDLYEQLTDFLKKTETEEEKPQDVSDSNEEANKRAFNRVINQIFGLTSKGYIAGYFTFKDTEYDPEHQCPQGYKTKVVIDKLTTLKIKSTLLIAAEDQGDSFYQYYLEWGNPQYGKFFNDRVIHILS